MSGKAKKRYIVQCTKHGLESKDWAGKQVVVSQWSNNGTTMNGKMGGCPHCKKDAEK